jgi:predicted nucleotidyltransferase
MSLQKSDYSSISRLVASEHALRALLVLDQSGAGLRTAEMARLLEVSYTGAEKALETLRVEGLAVCDDHRYSIVSSVRTEAVRDFALATLSASSALGAIAVGNPAVEFAGIDAGNALIVFRRFARPEHEAQAERIIARLQAFVTDLKVEFVRKEDLLDQLRVDASPRFRAQGLRILAGSIERTLPDRTRHGDFDAAPLGRLHPMIHAPSRRRLDRLAKTHGLRRILAFGSATRADFREDSDIDLLVEPTPGRLLSVGDRVRLWAEAESLFGRDVGILTAPVRRRSLAERIKRDGVVLYDATR